MAEPLTADAGACAPERDFPRWVAAEQKRIFLLCQRFLADREEADSAAQDVFLKAYKALLRGAVPAEDPARWLTRVAVNTCLDRLRSRRWQFWRKRPKPRDEELILALTPGAAPDAEARVLAGEIAQRIAAALERLSVRQRAVFTLRHYEDRTIEDIAAILGLDTGTVKAHLSRAVGKMREQLRDLYTARGRRA